MPSEAFRAGRAHGQQIVQDWQQQGADPTEYQERMLKELDVAYQVNTQQHDKDYILGILQGVKDAR